MDLLRLASSAGVQHVSAEYLKLPIESGSRQRFYLSRAFPDLATEYRSLDATRVGREFVLPAKVKAPGLLFLRDRAEAMGLKFGFAENEFLHLNQYESCCNAADLFLDKAYFFSGNILGIIKHQLQRKEIEFRLPKNEWLPKMSVFSHLNSRSRGKRVSNVLSQSPRARWKSLLEDKWNSTTGRGGPSSFWGIETEGKVDSKGNRIYTTGQVINDALHIGNTRAEG